MNDIADPPQNPQPHLHHIPHSLLFTLRLWTETDQPQQETHHMQVCHVLTGETRYFSAWPPLIDYLTSKSTSLQRPHDSPETP